MTRERRGNRRRSEKKEKKSYWFVGYKVLNSNIFSSTIIELSVTFYSQYEAMEKVQAWRKSLNANSSRIKIISIYEVDDRSYNDYIEKGAGRNL